jgi:cytochrome c oxidase subunit 2
LKRAAVFALFGATILLSACTGMQSALYAEGPAAAALKQLILLIVVVCAIVWLLVVLVLAWALLRIRRAGSDARREQKMRSAVYAAVAATVVIISGLTIASFYTTHAIGQAAEDALTIRVRGQQWWWQFIYVAPVSRAEFQTANELHIPAGRDVRLHLEGADVIHSFWVPSLAGKQDLIPGRTNTLTIHAERPGVYRGQCAEFCGLQHSHMALLIVAQSEADYRRWLEGQQRDRAPPGDPEAAAGETIFMSKPCAACHTIRGTSASGMTAPDLTHVGSRQTIGAGLLQNTRGALAAWTADPQTLKPGNNMPLVTLSSDELQKVSAYLESLK